RATDERARLELVDVHPHEEGPADEGTADAWPRRLDAPERLLGPPLVEIDPPLRDQVEEVLHVEALPAPARDRLVGLVARPRGIALDQPARVHQARAAEIG